MSNYPYFEIFHGSVRETARSVAKEFKETAAEADETGDYEHVKRNLQRLSELDLLAVTLPEAYGGVNAGMRTYVIVAEEIARGCTATAFALNSQLMCISSILVAGNDEQKKKFLPPLAKDAIGAFAATEPTAGSDLAALKTSAELEGDNYVLNGEKHYITNGSIADTFIVFAKTDPAKGARGISAFIIERDTPGLEMGRVEEKMGVKAAPATQLFLDDAKVPKANRLGKMGEGFNIALQTLDLGRTGLSAICVGVSKESLAMAVEYAKEREQFGQPIANHQGIRFMIADMATFLHAMENLTYHTAWIVDQGEQITKAAAMAKKFNSEHALDITDMTIQIFGGAGYTKEYPVERFYRDAKVTTIADGTTEIMNMVIARKIIGRLKESS